MHAIRNLSVVTNSLISQTSPAFGDMFSLWIIIYFLLLNLTRSPSIKHTINTFAKLWDNWMPLSSPHVPTFVDYFLIFPSLRKTAVSLPRSLSNTINGYTKYFLKVRSLAWKSNQEMNGTIVWSWTMVKLIFISPSISYPILLCVDVESRWYHSINRTWQNSAASDRWCWMIHVTDRWCRLLVAWSGWKVFSYSKVQCSVSPAGEGDARPAPL